MLGTLTDTLSWVASSLASDSGVPKTGPQKMTGVGVSEKALPWIVSSLASASGVPKAGPQKKTGVGR